MTKEEIRIQMICNMKNMTKEEKLEHLDIIETNINFCSHISQEQYLILEIVEELRNKLLEEKNNEKED